VSQVLVPEGLDAGAIWHFGSPSREGKLLDQGVGWADLSHLPVISISGTDRLSWLQNITTQEMVKLPTGQQSGALILDAQGHITHQLYLCDDGERTWIHTEASKADELIAFLERMKFMLRVEVEDRRSTHIVLRAPANIDLLGNQNMVDEFGGPYLIIEKNKFEEITSPWGVENQVGIWALEAQRIEQGRARILMETDHKSIPNELRMLNNFVHMKKGCYPGQETVAKVFNLGQPPRLLAFIHLDGSEHDLPHHGEEIQQDGKVVGFVGSAARHHILGPIALGVLKRSVVQSPSPAPLNINGVAGTIEPWKE
jgi:folate-binding protein YgfZ